ncbi:macrophage migration inhibitory factor-like protein (MIF2) [Leptomonas pyrrhocoris]|uniref:L-dopachrome isomerase n=1 Tax=Leptomonas pyrrhocoris TaxID=157538 RepID=A0A0M9G2Y7_LEPPY|nr:macrophage migration inhibitory factor-like protein (MIF2) [Leptomonas pyrrhocoris]XP_015659613.1 macrophage migration inhibitory factor-like protein (MIF2) [Leptomonas pyrrhocoris]KPA81173.1 macrophage migration inhibitory factor-like protein (MIF2) [Leptomonas pyrrhocoris]KPA81174.1 macrophage migration inhibitory factor-like protein (MIF2) [Leptomonas pyrrhocoris]|eukprot:XP_015659612.1 macrophage migration inhibitory factor-like protein (MIF2) [Leptomonas pyrrhocoris]
MPFLHTIVSTKLDDAQRAHLTKAFKTICREVFNKPEEFVMTAFNDETPMAFRDSTGPAAYIRVEVFGTYEPTDPAKATPAITAVVTKECGIPADRIYILYYGTPHIGWNGVNL